jgi:hypothetical protein
MTAQKFRVLIDDEVVPDPVFTIRPAGGIQARLEKVSDSSGSLFLKKAAGTLSRPTMQRDRA